MHVLLTEDDDLIASGIVAGLNAQGLTVDRVASAADTQALLQVARFDVLVLDLGLPTRTACACCNACASRASTCRCWC